MKGSIIKQSTKTQKKGMFMVCWLPLNHVGGPGKIVLVDRHVMHASCAFASAQRA